MASTSASGKRVLDLIRDGVIVARAWHLSDGKARLEYNSGVTVPLSFSLPISNGIDEKVVWNWLDNLLPDNKVTRAQLANRYGCSPETFDLLGTIGEDLAGSVSTFFSGETSNDESEVLYSVSRDDIAERILLSKTSSALPKEEFWHTMRMSLAGMQDKFTLALIPKQGMFLPNYRMPSTHIFKPGKIAHIEEYEHMALSMARRIGLDATDSRVMDFNGQSCFVAVRFDRYSIGNAKVRRPMEDLSQVLGIGQSSKYSSKLSLNDIISRLKTGGMAEDAIWKLVEQIIYNVLIGNSDAHVKNYSVFLDTLQFTPLYDSMPTFRFQGDLSMPINGKVRASEVGLMDWRNWATKLGIDASRVEHIVVNVLRGIDQYLPEMVENVGLQDLEARRVIEYIQNSNRSIVH